MRYADHKKTLDKYGRPKKTIFSWAPSYTPHIPKIARNYVTQYESHLKTIPNEFFLFVNRRLFADVMSVECSL